MLRRMGMPTRTASASPVPSKATATRAAIRAPTRLAIPGRAFASWITTGTRRVHAARYTGVETYPPTPTTTSARVSATIARAWRTARTSRAGSLRRSVEGRRGIGTRSMVRSSKPAAGTRRVSMPASVPTAVMRVPGRSSAIARAMASSGLM